MPFYYPNNAFKCMHAYTIVSNVYFFCQQVAETYKKKTNALYTAINDSRTSEEDRHSDQIDLSTAQLPGKLADHLASISKNYTSRTTLASAHTDTEPQVQQGRSDYSH